jgi:hypothetical protein
MAFKTVVELSHLDSFHLSRAESPKNMAFGNGIDLLGLRRMLLISGDTWATYATPACDDRDGPMDQQD